MFIRLLVLLMTSIFLTIFSLSSIASEYLDELSKEAESTANVSTNTQLDDKQKKEFEEMEALLETERPSTYKFYIKLYPKNKQHVFQTYASDPSDQDDRMTHLQKKVMDLYFNQ